MLFFLALILDSAVFLLCSASLFDPKRWFLPADVTWLFPRLLLTVIPLSTTCESVCKRMWINLLCDRRFAVSCTFSREAPVTGRVYSPATASRVNMPVIKSDIEYRPPGPKPRENCLWDAERRRKCRKASLVGFGELIPSFLRRVLCQFVKRCGAGARSAPGAAFLRLSRPRKSWIFSQNLN